MNIFMDTTQVFTLTDLQKQVLCNDNSSDIIDSDIARRLEWVIMHKHAICMQTLREEWNPLLLANGITSVPLDDDTFAQLVFSQPNYMDRKARDAAASQGTVQ